MIEEASRALSAIKTAQVFHACSRTHVSCLRSSREQFEKVFKSC